MKFLDKLTKLAENVANNIEDSAANISKTYQEKGFKGLVDKTNESLDSLAQNSQNYVNKLSDLNKEILKSNKTDKFEDKLSAAAAVVVNTTQTIMEDVVKATKSTVENATKDKADPVQETVVQTPEAKAPVSDVETIIQKSKKDTRPLLQNILSDAEIISLDCTPLSIVIEELGGVQDKRIPGKWKLEDQSIMITHKKWYSFTTGVGNDGALTFLKAALNDFKTIENEDVSLNNKQTDMALVNLQKTQSEPDYQTKLSAWIKEQTEFEAVRSKVKVTTAQKEDLADALAKAPVKRVRKPKVEVTPVEEPEVVAKTPRKRKPS